MVVGGTHGMGLAIVRALIAGGADVVLTGSDERNVEVVRDELEERAHAVRSDVTHASDRDELGTLVRERFGTVDFVFLNAGHAKLEPFHEVTEESFDRQFDINAKGTFFTAQRLASLVREGGALVCTTSVANASGNPGMAVYSGAKAALNSFVQVLAAELLPRGVRVNAVSPGFVRTPTMGVSASADDRAAFEREGSELTPMGRVGSPEEVARAALFLASEATFTTGVELPVDGGIAQGLVPAHG